MKVSVSKINGSWICWVGVDFPHWLIHQNWEDRNSAPRQKDLPWYLNSEHCDQPWHQDPFQVPVCIHLQVLCLWVEDPCLLRLMGRAKWCLWNWAGDGKITRAWATMEASLHAEGEGRLHVHAFVEFTKAVDWESTAPVAWKGSQPNCQPCWTTRPEMEESCRLW
jgi:hypothetical protein